jgi:hypothetical protein
VGAVACAAIGNMVETEVEHKGNFSLGAYYVLAGETPVLVHTVKSPFLIRKAKHV